MRFMVVLYLMGCTSVAVFFYVYSAQQSEHLTGKSHWMTAIAFTVAMKTSMQLLYGIHVIRTHFLAQAIMHTHKQQQIDNAQYQQV